LGTKSTINLPGWGPSLLLTFQVGDKSTTNLPGWRPSLLLTSQVGDQVYY